MREAAGTTKNLRDLAGWAASTGADAIPRSVLERGARVLVDDLAAIVGARDEPEVQRFHARLCAAPTREESTLFRGGRSRLDRFTAAVGNATAGDFLELDEGYRAAPCHAGLYVVPALIAHAETFDLPLREMLRALVVAYEIVTRVARTWPPREMNLHSHARYCAVGAAAATALASGADASLLMRALTCAATLVNTGPRNHLIKGALARNVWPAAGAWSGMMSVEWAQCGIAGADDAFDDVYAGLLGSEPQPEHLVARLGEQWAVLDGYMKMFACCQHLHSTVEAALTLRGDTMSGVEPDSIESIEVRTHPLALLLPNARPATTLAAKFSLPHAVAASLVTRTGGASAFAATTLHDPAIGRLRECVRMLPYEPLPPPPHDRPAQVTLRMSDGRRVHAECLSARGGSDRPFPPEVLDEKIALLVEPVYPRFGRVAASLMRLEETRMAQAWRRIVDDLCEDAR